jgi:hypothetical protein
MLFNLGLIVLVRDSNAELLTITDLARLLLRRCYLSAISGLTSFIG